MQCRRGHAYWIPTSPVQAPGPQVSVSSRFGDACQVSRRVRRASTRPRRRRAQGPTSCHQAVGDKGVHAHGERPDVVGNAGSLGGFPRFCNGEFGCRARVGWVPRRRSEVLSSRASWPRRGRTRRRYSSDCPSLYLSTKTARICRRMWTPYATPRRTSAQIRESMSPS